MTTSGMDRENERFAETPGRPIDARQADDRPAEGGFLEQAVELLSQQTWCWGRDIMRPEGNWLMEIGFDRIQPPDERDGSSVYSLLLPPGRCVVLRAFGVFYGDSRYGGVFLPRFEFRPLYTTTATLIRPPWSRKDLPELQEPTESQRASCVALTLDLIDWLRSYEVGIVERLGIEYRRSTLVSWDTGERLVTPAEEMASAWRTLGVAIADDLATILPTHRSISRRAAG